MTDALKLIPASAAQPDFATKPELVCYALEPDPPAIVPGRADRDWMDFTDRRYAYRCIPLSMANASGWEILSPVSFSATWVGGDEKSAITITSRSDAAKAMRFATSHFGHGVLTLHTGYLFRTSPGWALWCRGAPNTAKRHLTPLDGLVETDWLPFPFTMNWRFTRIGTVRFEAGEPFCFITPFAHAVLDAVQPVFRKLDDDPALKAAHEAWSASRADFNTKLSERDPGTVAQGWQRNYVRGNAGSGIEQPSYHLSKRRLRAPKPA